MTQDATKTNPRRRVVRILRPIKRVPANIVVRKRKMLDLKNTDGFGKSRNNYSNWPKLKKNRRRYHNYVDREVYYRIYNGKRDKLIR